MQPIIKFKRGDTFRLTCARVDSEGDPVPITGLVITSQVRVDAFVDNLVLQVVSAQAGIFRLSRSATNTAQWPISKIKCDVQFVGANTESTETFIIDNQEDITRDD